MKQLYIAEKPSLAAVVAKHIWPNDQVKKGSDCYDGGDIVVTWSFGHILRLAEPEEYDERNKSWSIFPFYPVTWQLKVSSEAREHFSALKKMIANAQEIVHVGDPDREGQLLIDEILFYCQNKAPVKRLLLLGLDDTNVAKAFKNMRDNKEFFNLYTAGVARQKADWLVGMNLTRAYTTYTQRAGYTSTMPIGRVKTPTLALVVRREAEIQNFVSKDFYELFNTFEKDGIQFKAKMKPGDNLETDSEGRILSLAPLETDQYAVKSGTGKVVFVETKEKTEHPPLPHSLDTLQIEANKMYKLSPAETLAIVQDMYEAKYVTYPRSDCNYLPDAQFADSGAILDSLASHGFKPAATATKSIKSAAWNDKKVTAHTAIVPTGVYPKNLDEQHQKIYELIAMRFCIQFYEPCKSKATNFEIEVEGRHFIGTGTAIVSPGFKNVLKPAVKHVEDDEANNTLPALQQGDTANIINSQIVQKKTTPPERFTEGTLLKAMANIYKYMDPKNPNREKLKEVKGIGTPATRATIISELINGTSKKQVGETYLKVVKGKLQPTEYGIFTIKNIDESLTHPDTTAVMEFSLSQIVEGKKDPNDYIHDVQRLIETNIEFAAKRKFPPPANMEMCPVCKNHPLKAVKFKNSKKNWFVCADRECKVPGTEKTIYYLADRKSKPTIILCPDCGTPLQYSEGQYGEFWRCIKCQKIVKVDNGKVVKEAMNSEVTDVLCPICKKSHLKKVHLKDGNVSFVCENKECVDPETGKATWYIADAEGNPLIVLCPDCGVPLKFGQGNYGPYCFCNKCKSKFDYEKAKAGNPVKLEKAAVDLTDVDCPICGKHKLKRINTAKGIRYVCADRNCKKPNSGYQMYYPDKDGKPNIQKCAKCGKLLDFLPGKDGKNYWKCQNCGEFYNDNDGTPVKQEKKKK